MTDLRRFARIALVIVLASLGPLATRGWAHPRIGAVAINVFLLGCFWLVAGWRAP